MKLQIPAPKNLNYCATVVRLQEFVDLPNCDNVKGALIFGNHVIVGKETRPGDIGLFFPAETALSHNFLRNNNLYRKAEYGNVLEGKGGFFEQNGRVRAVKFRGHKSEGFWIPLDSLAYLGLDHEALAEGTDFDTIGDEEICRKYVVPTIHVQGPKRQSRGPRLEDRIVPGQFQFHIDTENFRRNYDRLKPSDIISITDKWHGTSAVFAHTKILRNLAWWERALKRLGVRIDETQYGYTWASRRVIKGVDGSAKAGAAHYYESDVWGEVFEKVKAGIPPGYTVYGEIVGYTKDGQAIQKGYHYGCQPGQNRFMVYRVTFTGDHGVVELTDRQMREFCLVCGLECVPLYFYGQARDLLLPDQDNGGIENWQKNVLSRLENTWVVDRRCAANNFEVPAEGIAIRIEHLDACEIYKLKNFAFLEHETKLLDKGEVDMDAQETAV